MPLHTIRLAISTPRPPRENTPIGEEEKVKMQKQTYFSRATLASHSS